MIHGNWLWLYVSLLAALNLQLNSKNNRVCNTTERTIYNCGKIFSEDATRLWQANKTETYGKSLSVGTLYVMLEKQSKNKRKT